MIFNNMQLCNYNSIISTNLCFFVLFLNTYCTQLSNTPTISCTLYNNNKLSYSKNNDELHSVKDSMFKILTTYHPKIEKTEKNVIQL